MSDELVVSGGGSTAVAVDELFVEAARLSAVEATTGDWSARAAVIWRGVRGLDIDPAMDSWETRSPTWLLEHADRCLRQANEQASDLRASLLTAAERYGATERLIDGLWQFAAIVGAPWLGFHAPALIGGGLAVTGSQWAVSAIWRAAGWGPTPVEAWLQEHRGLLSDPLFARLVRVAADHADEVAAGAAHVPMPGWLGSMVGAPESASIILGLAGALGLGGSRLLVDAPVKVDRAASPRAVPPPTGIGDLADRVPSGDGTPQIRVERYGEAGDRRWIVYVGGTVDFGLVAGEQPADTTSNAHGIADDTMLDVLRIAGAESGAGERAVREAMEAAGVRPGEPVLAVGYSGGGIIAADLAADPTQNTVGAVSLGGPVASAPTREGVGLLSIEHVEDFVPATGGSGHPSPDRVTVSRSVIEPGREYEALVPAHQLSRYRETAALVDESEEARLVSFGSLVDEVTGGTPGLRSDWEASRDLSPATDER